MWVLPHYVKNTLANGFNSPICAKNRSTPLVASVRSEPRSRKLLRCCPEDVNYLLRKYATDQAIAENDAAILRYMQPSSMTPQQFADDLQLLSPARSRTSTTKKP